MGSSASLAPDTIVDLEKAKELAGEKWNAEMEVKISAKLTEHGTVPLKDAKCVMPELFYGDTMTLETVTQHTLQRGAQWNDELNAIFDTNAVVAKNDAGVESKTISTESWKSLVPTLFEMDKERVARLHKEFLAMLAARSEGMVVINYQMYNEQFPVSENTLTAARIDEDYGLTDVMPGCRIRLSNIDSKARTLYENNHDGRPAPWVREEPEGTFRDLLAGETYYCIVFEDAAQYAKDMAELQKKRLETDADVTGAGVGAGATGPRVEGCSCLFGNPCVDQYICKDWDNRCAVAKKNGWKGF
jgi:hypothetical protein